jgi:AAHS family 4-hydroxybenzoate transporter-like MFS transporter
MKTSAKINVSEIVDNSRMGGFQWKIFGLCLTCLIMDGFDVQALGFAAPVIIREWNIPNSALGPVFGIANFGFMIGSLFSGVADKIGRRPILIGATIFFSFFTLVAGMTNSVSQLFAIRFIAGLGMGCIIPNAAALIGEYSPRRLRAAFMAVITVGFSAGAAIGGFVAAFLIPTFGWRSVFYFGGAIPLAAALVMLVSLPESLQFMVLRGKTSRVGKWLKRIDPTAPIAPDTEYIVNEENRAGVPVGHLFREGRVVATILFWIVNFMNLLNLYFLANWMATVVRDLGYPTSTAVLVSTTLQVGGTVGGLALAWLIARKGFVPVLVLNFALACVSIAIIGLPGISLTVLYALVFIAGWCVVGGQPALNSLSGSYYPTYMRTTGIGWALGIGRIGAIVGPVVGGEFMALKWSTQGIFYAAAVPALISTLAMFSLRWVLKPRFGVATK